MRVFGVLLLALLAVVACALGNAPSPTPLPTATLIPNVPAVKLIGPTGAVDSDAAFDVQVSLDCPVATRGTQFGLSDDPSAIEATGVAELQTDGSIKSAPSVQLVDVTIPVGTGAPSVNQPPHRLMGPATPRPWGTVGTP